MNLEEKDEKGETHFIPMQMDDFINYRLDQIFVLCWKMVGLPESKYPDEETIRLILMNTKKHFGEFSFEDVLLAFELGVNGKSNADVKHYHTVSPAYVSEMLRGYQEFKRSEINALNKKLDYYSTDLLSEYEESVNKNDHSIKNMILRGYNNFTKGGKRGDTLIDESCFQYLKDQKCITVDRNKWTGFIELAKKEKLKRFDNVRDGLKALEKFNPVAQAKIMVVYSQFEIWRDNDLISWIDLGRQLVQAPKVLPLNYNEKIKELTEHNNNLIV